MSLTLHLPLIHRRPKCPPAPPQVIRTGLVCHCIPKHHAVSEADRDAVEAELAAAQAAGNGDLTGALTMRLERCPNPGRSGVSE